MKLAGVLRVSTGKQADDGDGLGVQKAAISAWAKTHGHKITWVQPDVITGSSDMIDRPGLMEALALIKERKAHGLVVFKLDRLARDLIVQESLLAEVKRAGGQVFSTSAAEADFLVDDPKDPSRKMIRQILGAVSEYERAMIRLRLAAGRQRKADLGGYAYGSPPLGVKAVERTLVADVDEERTVERIRELRASGASLRAICHLLEKEGHSTKRGNTTWQSAVVGRIIERLGGTASDSP